MEEEGGQSVRGAALPPLVVVPCVRRVTGRGRERRGNSVAGSRGAGGSARETLYWSSSACKHNVVSP